MPWEWETGSNGKILDIGGKAQGYFISIFAAYEILCVNQFEEYKILPPT